MEARGRRVGGGFPGYNGPALPRAMRSARGRGEAGRQTSEIGGRAGFFELLATVAGQFLQDASVGQEQESDKLKQKSLQVADSMLVTSSQKLQIGNSPCLGPCHSGSDDRDMWKHNVALSKQNSLSGGAPLAANSCDSSVAVQQNTTAVKEDQLLESGASPFSNISCEVVSPEAMDPVEGGAAKSSQALAGCSHDGKVMNGDCHSGTACARQEIDNIENLENGVDLGAQGEMPGLCKTSEMPHKQNMDGNDHCLCNMLWEESHSCDIASDAQDHIQSMSKDSRGPNSDSCDGTAVVKEETVEQVSSRQTPVQQSLDVVKDHGDASIDVNMDARMDLEDYVESNRHMCIAEKKLDNTMCESQDFKPVVDAGNSLSVNVSSIEEAVGSEEAEQVGTQSKYTMQEDPGEIRPVDLLAEKKVCRGLRRKTSDLLREANMKDSYAKGSKPRKLAKVARHTRGSGSCSKRKHAEMELQSDTDVVHGKRGFFGDIAFTRQRTSRSFSAKRKKMEEGTDNLLPNLELNGKPLTVECADGEPPAAAAKLRSAKAASVASSPTAGPSKLPSKKSAEPHVKLSIKSFTVPEFLVDLPESATVANLKRAVMDAAMELLGGGLRVRVLLQGKKVPDEGVSLGQMGISRHGKPESLGFMLEPSPVPPSPTAAEDPLLVLSRAAAQPSPRYPVFTVPGLPVTGDAGRAPCKSRANKGSSVLEADGAFGTVACEQQIVGDPNGLSFAVEPDDSTNGCNGSKSLPHDPSDDSLVSASGAIILHPSMGGENMQGMALVPVRQKLRAIDTSKRRIRRPFSVAEVEALVHAVEKLGTGRWRDVKLRAFDQAKHRTYVDLKDKWKTLVHTARIAPHQRRGEPVPQELLERVTRAHTYWAAQQAKQQADLDF